MTTRSVVCGRRRRRPATTRQRRQEHCRALTASSCRSPDVDVTPSWRSSSIICAAFSAIMMVGVLVLPEVMVGITEASTTRRPSRPHDAQPLVDHRHRIGRQAHLRRADRMEDRGADVAGGLGERGVVVADRRARAGIPPDGRAQRRLLHQAARDADRVGRDAAVLRRRRDSSARSSAWPTDRPSAAGSCRARSGAGCRR